MSIHGRFADTDMQSVDARALLNGRTLAETSTGNALIALQEYAKLEGISGSPEEIARDLLTDLLHLADAFGFRADWVDVATDAYEHEN
jgi:hypothetical protein